MILIILGLVAFFAAGSLRKMQQPLPNYTKTIRIVAFLLIALGVFTSCIVQIDAGKIGTQSLFGKVDNTVLRSGLHLINPMMDVNQIDVRTQNYTMSAVHDEGDKQGDDAIKVLTSDGLEVARPACRRSIRGASPSTQPNRCCSWIGRRIRRDYQCSSCVLSSGVESLRNWGAV